MYENEYGVLVLIAITASRYCHCDVPTCIDKKYDIHQTAIRIKKDEDLKYLELYLESQKHIWEKKDDVESE